MLNVTSFIECITENLKERNFSKDRIASIVKNFELREKFHQVNGKNDVDASILAMRDTFDSISKEALEKAKRTAATLAVHATHMNAIKEGLVIDTKAFTMKDMSGKQIGPRGSRGHAVGMAAVSLLEKNPNFSAMSYELQRETLRTQFYAIFGSTFDKIALGMLGRQKGKAHIVNVASEMFKPGSTGDKTAQALAEAWDKIGQLGPDLMNQAGGSMNKLARYLPQPFNNMAKLLKAGSKDFVERHLELLDWNNTRYPDGSPIEVGQREKFLKDVFETKSSDGVNKLDADSYRGQGRAMGNMLDQHRLLHYKDAESWSLAHQLYGDGSVFDVMVHHIDDLSHRIAAVRTFGPNPDLAAKNIETAARKVAYDAGLRGKELSEVEDVFKNKFNPMFEVMMRKNPMNPDSVWGATVTGANNLSTAALLGQAVFASAFGDKATMSVVRKMNGMPMFGGANTYLKALVASPAEQRQLAIQSGFIMDSMAHSMSSIERFNPAASIGPHATRRLADLTIRGSGMNAMTNAQRWVGQSEQLGFMHTLRGKEFDKLPIKEVMLKYGITSSDWDAFRAIESFSPREGANWLRPIDILKTNLKNKQELYTKFQGMVLQESRHMVPSSTVEATVSLRGTTRPNTVLGTIAYSFSAFKNFPITYTMLYGRMGLRSSNAGGRLGFYAGLAAATTTGGVMAAQLSEVAKGRDPLSWDDPRLWGKGFMKGGGAGILGDFLFADVGEYGQDLGDVVSGPALGLAGDVTALAFGDAFSIVNELAKNGDLQNYDSKTGQRAVQLARRYTPGSNLWHSGLLFQRKFWDAMEDIADPKSQRKRDNRMRKQEKDYGNEYWWPLGENSPERLPEFKVE